MLIVSVANRYILTTYYSKIANDNNALTTSSLLLVRHRVTPPHFLLTRPTRSPKPRNRNTKTIYRRRNAAPLCRLATESFPETNPATRRRPSPRSAPFPLRGESRQTFVSIRALVAMRATRALLGQLLNPPDGVDPKVNRLRPKKKRLQ